MVSLHAVMVLFITITFWRTLLCWKGSLLEFMVLCSRSFVFQICNCQSTSLQIFWISTHSQQVNDFILIFKYKFNFKIVTGFQTNMLSFEHTVCSSAKLWELLSSSPLSKRDNEFIIHIVRLFKLLLGFVYRHTQSQKILKLSHDFLSLFSFKIVKGSHILSIFAFGLHKHNCFYINTL